MSREEKDVYAVFVGVVGAAIISWPEKRTAGTSVFMAVRYSSVSSETLKVAAWSSQGLVQVLPV